jgi:hypothetical protein
MIFSSGKLRQWFSDKLRNFLAQLPQPIGCSSKPAWSAALRENEHQSCGKVAQFLGAVWGDSAQPLGELNTVNFVTL